MNIITGYVGEPHVTSQQERNTNIAIFGSGVYIANGVGSELEATIVSANLVEIADGLLIAEGCTAEITRGTTESLVIENGSQGMKRTDLIVARYTRNANTGAESMELVVIKGTSAASNPAVPSYNTGLIADGDAIVDFPIYQVNIDGISITSVDALVGTVNISDAIGDLADRVDVLYEDDLEIRFALERDNISIAAGQSFTWFGAHVNLPGYRPKSIAGTRLYNATQNGANYLNCGFSFCEVYRNTSTGNDDIDFAIRNHDTAAAKIHYRIEILYQKVR